MKDAYYIKQNIYETSDMTKILIAGHDKIVTGSLSPPSLQNHWFGLTGIFEQIIYDISIPKERAVFETVDIQPGGTHQQDVFSDDFITQHLDEYDLVLIPDLGASKNATFCGIPFDKKHNWYALQETKNIYTNVPKTSEEIQMDLNMLIAISLKLTQIVKKDGYLFFGKFINLQEVETTSGIFENVSHALSHFLMERGFVCKIKNYSGSYDILAKKI